MKGSPFLPNDALKGPTGRQRRARDGGYPDHNQRLNVGHERAYNRWYEDDHYNAGAMAFPWMWAGRRWVAPVPYQKVRYPADSAIAQPLEAGKYISTYWITDGQYENLPDPIVQSTLDQIAKLTAAQIPLLFHGDYGPTSAEAASPAS